MSLKLYQMNFKNAHFGNGYLNKADETFEASRLYSALFLEAQKLGKIEDFNKITSDSNFIISDAFPIINNVPFIPKPIGFPKIVKEKVSAQQLKKSRQNSKKVKKINYISINSLDDYLNQKADVEQLYKEQNVLSRKTLVGKVGKDPYDVEVSFMKVPLYVLMPESPLINELMTSLQYSGLGGKRGEGYGRFDLKIDAIPSSLKKRIKFSKRGQMSSYWMALSTCYPQADELEDALIDANYLLKKDSGYTFSPTESKSLRKKDLYKFKAGSTFKNLFKGDIFDVRPRGFSHPVYNFSRALFFKIGKE